MLGRAFNQLLNQDPRLSVTALARNELDVTQAPGVEEAFARYQPRIVLNCAAFTDVDRCERDPEGAHLGNVVGPRVVAEACMRTGASLVHISTDFVFNGKSTRPYSESDQAEPISAYGRSKLEGERAVAAYAVPPAVSR